jgi:hypothetical protein
MEGVLAEMARQTKADRRGRCGRLHHRREGVTAQDHRIAEALGA